ncbi:hypothetical protein P171DRAFT_448428 [Karstenula rhodostoma CBS 690.94]|uniref:Uncharacterized protein n=1 Tax=Karstenula rhodostoma CBS 690.94 TaxID=1392251 RepID=A0A9P4P8W4_9PLEO|nr:hypothetical protein P171DRAFT_448428 [Karstenula rhodostoma CBS 690.94]
MAPFKFMKLCGELRNQVYKIHAASESESKLLHRPNAAQLYTDAELPPNRFALAQTCHQLRIEYLTPCWRDSRIKVRWEDAPAFFQQFLPCENNVVTNCHRAPRKLTILVGADYVESGPSLEMLPLVQLHAIARTKCLFDVDEDRVHSRRQHDNVEVDCNTMQLFLTGGFNQYWRDVALGKFNSILWSRVYKASMLGSDKWQQRVQVVFKQSSAPDNWAVVEGHDCPKYLAETVFADMDEVDRSDLQGRFACTFTTITIV